MDKNEIALQITLKAIEHDVIRFDTRGINYDDNAMRDKMIQATTEFNTKLIIDFYNAVAGNIKT